MFTCSNAVKGLVPADAHHGRTTVAGGVFTLKPKRDARSLQDRIGDRCLIPTQKPLDWILDAVALPPIPIRRPAEHHRRRMVTDAVCLVTPVDAHRVRVAPRRVVARPLGRHRERDFVDAGLRPVVLVVDVTIGRAAIGHRRRCRPVHAGPRDGARKPSERERAQPPTRRTTDRGRIELRTGAAIHHRHRVRHRSRLPGHARVLQGPTPGLTKERRERHLIGTRMSTNDPIPERVLRTNAHESACVVRVYDRHGHLSRVPNPFQLPTRLAPKRRRVTRRRRERPLRNGRVQPSQHDATRVGLPTQTSRDLAPCRRKRHQPQQRHANK